MTTFLRFYCTASRKCKLRTSGLCLIALNIVKLFLGFNKKWCAAISRWLAKYVRPERAWRIGNELPTFQCCLQRHAKLDNRLAQFFLNILELLRVGLLQ